MARDTRQRGRFMENDPREDEEEEDDRDLDQDDEDTEDDEDDNGDDYNEADLPDAPPMKRGRPMMRKGVAPAAVETSVAARFIKAVQQESDERLSPNVRAAIRELIPELVGDIKKSVGAPRSEIRVSSLAKALGQEFREGFEEILNPLVARVARNDNALSRIEKAVNDSAVTAEEIFEAQEQIKKALGNVNAQSELVKSLGASREELSKSVPARKLESGPAPQIAYIEPSPVRAVGAPVQAGYALGEQGASELETLLEKAVALRTEHFVEVPGYAEALQARAVGKMSPNILEDLRKSVTAIDREIKGFRD